ncbi:MAG: GNAT family N-acetyltransferase [Candidatus Thorarchaeota archaeon]|jgi:RimJ/RimL family protein N-acetyltransferase
MYYGNLVCLRAIEVDDLDDLMKYINNVETRRFLGGILPNSRKSEKEWLEGASTADPWKDGRFVLAIEDKKSREFLGTISFFDISKMHRHAEFGIALWNTEGQDKGFGTDATLTMLWVGFHILGLNNIYLYVHADNAIAHHVYEKVGFKKIGTFREMVFSMGKFHDHIAMDILRSEFLEQYPPGTLVGEP